MNLVLRKDLEPWSCSLCLDPFFEGKSFNKKFYCHNCFLCVEMGLEAAYGPNEDLPEVNFTEEEEGK